MTFLSLSLTCEFFDLRNNFMFLFTPIPSSRWDHRASGAMRVWIPEAAQ